MSGIEIAGLVLGSIPLILEAFDRSERTFDAFRTYRKYPKEIEKLNSRIGAQKTVFRNNCNTFLTILTDDRRRIHEMVHEPTSNAWNEQGLGALLKFRLDQRRVESISATLDSCHRTMKQILEALQDISATTAFLSASLPELASQTLNARERFRSVSNKIRLSIQKPRIKERIEELRILNTDFTILANQLTENFRALTQKSGRHASMELHFAARRLAKCRDVRLASEKLHETLVKRWACSAHPKHTAHICLDEDDHQEAEEDRTKFGVPRRANNADRDSCISFEIKVIVSDSRQKEAILLSVDSDLGTKSGTTQQVVSSDIRKLVEIAGTDDVESILEQSALLQHLESESSSQEKPGPAQLANPKSSIVKALDLCLVEDYCHYFKEHCTMTPLEKRACIGFLGGNGVFRFYSKEPQSIVVSTSWSLADLISWVSAEPIMRSFPRPFVFGLASSIARMVLQFHTTPWLRPSWRSKDLQFFLHFFDAQNVDQMRKEVSLQSPHLNTEFPGASFSQQKTPEQPHSPEVDQEDDLSAQLARNETLFRLGIVLLELGFEQTWDDLRQIAEKTLPDRKKNGYFVAEKLARLLANKMGPEYARIVRMCLGCDFGLGESDLASERLQQSFCIEVINALQELNEKLPS